MTEHQNTPPDLTATTLRGLRERVQKATGADRELDADIAVKIAGIAPSIIVGDGVITERRHVPAFYPHYTSSIDAAVALIERLLPGWHWEVGRDASAMVRDPGVIGASADHCCWANQAKTPVTALLFALLSALIAQGEAAASDEVTP